MQRFINQLIPFILVGIAIVAVVFGLMLLAYLILIGAAIGLVLFTANWLKEKLFPSKKITREPQHKIGRTLDSDDWKKL